MENIEREKTIPTQARTEDGLVALEYNDIGDKFELSEMFDKKTEEDKGIAYVLFSTGSENIYLLTPDGRIINGNKSQETGELKEKKLNPEMLQLLDMEVGNPFPYVLALRTTGIKSILVVTNEKYSSDEMGEVPKTQMVEEFKKKMGDVRTLSPDDRQSLENILKGGVK